MEILTYSSIHLNHLLGSEQKAGALLFNTTLNTILVQEFWVFLLKMARAVSLTR